VTDDRLSLVFTALGAEMNRDQVPHPAISDQKEQSA
jgi:hypothetical protein